MLRSKGGQRCQLRSILRGWNLKACSWVTRTRRPDFFHENQSGEENKGPVASHPRPDQEARLLLGTAHSVSTKGCSVWGPETETGVTGPPEQVGLSQSGRQTRSMCSESGTSPVHIRSVLRAWDQNSDLPCPIGSHETLIPTKEPWLISWRKAYWTERPRMLRLDRQCWAFPHSLTASLHIHLLNPLGAIVHLQHVCMVKPSWRLK